MKLLLLFFLLFPALARSEEGHTPLWLLLAPEAHQSSLFRDSGWSARPDLEFHVGLGERFTAVGTLTYYEHSFGVGSLRRLNYGPGVAYDLIPERLRVVAHLYFSYLKHHFYEGDVAFGAGLKAEYFVPIRNSWRMFLSLGWDLLDGSSLRHDTSVDPGTGSRCAFFCFLKDEEKKGHIYDYVTIPGSREFSGAVGMAYSFF